MRVRIRRQLTLFIDDHYSENIEKIRGKYNPVQFDLIRSHVTLCREDELENLPEIKHRLKSLNFKSVALNFNKIIRFSGGKGLMIPTDETDLQYHYLRHHILKDLHIELQFPRPHITLMHPGNSTCTDEIFNEINEVIFPASIIFNKVSLIEQVEGSKWEIIETFQL